MRKRSLEQITSSLNEGSMTLVDLINDYLNAIQQNQHVNAYIEYWPEEAISRARALDEKRLRGENLGKLHGVVLSIKDVICYKDHLVTAASNILAGFRSPYSATAVNKLLEEDAIIIGRTNCDEFAMGSTNENSCYGPTFNALDPERVPGGSSGGAAVSVQIDSCLVALGSDTGGSVRQPAAFCGINGFKPSYGAVSRYGLIAYGSSFDQIGLMSKDLKAVSVVNEVITGRDIMDSTSVDLVDDARERNIERPRFITFKEVTNNINHRISSDFVQYKELLGKRYGMVSEFDFPLINYLVPTYYTLTTAEASSNLGRYDGVRYGHRADHAGDLSSLYTATRSEGFGKEVKRRIFMGTFVLSVGYYDAYFGKAQQIRRMLHEYVKEIFQRGDFIVLPTTTDIPWKIGDSAKDPIRTYQADIFTVLANLTGLPAISIPIASKKNHLFPSSLQIIGPYGSDQRLIMTAELLAGTIVDI